jgi:putative ABC transport system permease protein
MNLSMDGRFRGDRDGEKFLAFNTQVLERVRAVPGVQAAGISHFLPLGGGGSATGFWRADQPYPGHGSEPVTDVLVVMPGYFAALNIPLVRGRVFTEHDRAGSPLAILVNQTLANQYYRNEDPVGKRLYVEWNHPNDTYEIVGVVGDVHQRALNADTKAAVFLATAQAPTSPVNLVVRSQGDPRQLANAIQAEIHSLDSQIPISDVKRMDEYVSDSVAAPRFNTILLGGFALLALVLAAVGIFGVISYSVAQRTQEIGIRRALGADTVSVMRLVLIQGMGLTAIGVAIGLGGAFAVTRLLQTLLFNVTPTDSVTFVSVAAVLSGVAFIATYLPARRAAKVDPMIALRHE